MLIRLTDKQVSTYWEDVKAHVRYSLPIHMEFNDKAMSNILDGLIKGDTQCWVGLDKDKDPPDPVCMILTAFSTEYATKTKNLVIFSFSAYSHLVDEVYAEGIQVLKQFAAKNKCHRLIAYTQIPRILDVAKKLDGDISTTLLSWEV
ncbi:hypothetical protein LCGC14_0622330 [marine sediment metagenome]|uniref:Uncharacterized protein n=1 Tax=marine sediment metagenome TaxID=412755 RepID=A0A0F9RNU1_9ZZZZ